MYCLIPYTPKTLVFQRLHSKTPRTIETHMPHDVNPICVIKYPYLEITGPILDQISTPPQRIGVPYYINICRKVW